MKIEFLVKDTDGAHAIEWNEIIKSTSFRTFLNLLINEKNFNYVH